jgi:hypothetical protein
MPRTPGGKKGRQANMRAVRLPKRLCPATDDSSDTSPTPTGDEDEEVYVKPSLSEKKERTMDVLNKLNVKNRELKVEKKKNLLIKMENMRKESKFFIKNIYPK